MVTDCLEAGIEAVLGTPTTVVETEDLLRGGEADTEIEEVKATESNVEVAGTGPVL